MKLPITITDEERKAIFKVHMKPLKVDETMEVDFLAKQTPGFSGADIANVCNEAALIAARKNKSFVEKQDFMDAVDRIVGGLEKKSKITTVAEKKSIAYHEAGHATISWMTEHANPIVKVTIVPRGEALGAAWYLPEERQLTNREHMLDEMCSTLGGRAAEEVFLKQMSTGAINDLERVTKRAYAMVAYFGMSDKLANMSYYDSTGNSDYGFTKPYSEKTAELIDSEAKQIVADEYKRAKKILTENARGHNTLAELLIEKEVIFLDEVRYDFKNTKMSTGLYGIYRIFLPTSNVFPTLVASDTNDYVTTTTIDTNEYKQSFIDKIYKKGNYRKITKEESCLIQGFPKNYILPENRSRWMRLIGNSVSVPVIDMLGKAIIETGVFN